MDSSKGGGTVVFWRPAGVRLVFHSITFFQSDPGPISRLVCDVLRQSGKYMPYLSL